MGRSRGDCAPLCLFTCHGRRAHKAQVGRSLTTHVSSDDECRSSRGHAHCCCTSSCYVTTFWTVCRTLPPICPRSMQLWRQLPFQPYRRAQQWQQWRQQQWQQWQQWQPEWQCALCLLLRAWTRGCRVPQTTVSTCRRARSRQSEQCLGREYHFLFIQRAWQRSEPSRPFNVSTRRIAWTFGHAKCT